MSTPSPIADVRSISQIYKSGDLMLENPAEAGIIFVSVILVSAVLEYILQAASSIENKYARMMVETMSQEITIIGVLALLLMFGTSVIPSGFVETKYVTLFTWANMCLFFMAFFFVATVLLLFVWAGFAVQSWRTFEEGLMDTLEEEKMSFSQKMFKKAAETYAKKLKKECSMSASEVPYFELINVTLRKQLVRLSNLSYRTWFWLTLVVLLNLARARATPFLKRTEDNSFGNAGMFIGTVGWTVMFVYIIFFAIMQFRMKKFFNGDYEGDERLDSPGSFVTFGSSKRGLEFIQVIVMSINWYGTLFVTGLGKEAATLRGSYLAVIVVTFWIPIIVIAALLPWSIMSITILGSLGNISKSEMERIYRQVKGELADSDEDDESDDDDDGGSSHGGALTRRSSMSSMTSRTGTKVEGRQEAKPGWLDSDDEWDGKRTKAAGTAAGGANGGEGRFGHLYHANVDHSKVLRHLSGSPDRKQSVMDGGRTRFQSVMPRDEDDAGTNRNRPTWLDDDEADLRF